MTKRIAFTDEQLRIVMAALELYVSREQQLAQEQGIDATADQSRAEEILDALEEGLPPAWA
jgi:hypothetical protein